MDFRNEDAMELDMTQDDTATVSDAPASSPAPNKSPEQTGGKAIDMQASDSGSDELVSE